MNPYNRADTNVRMAGQIPRNRLPTNNPRFVYIASQNNFTPIQNTPTNVPIIQTQSATNQSSVTQKLGKFFKNLLELEKDQGCYDDSVAIIQRYINKEISVDELGTQLKRNASKAPLPESLMTSLKSNIDDLRREMFYGRVKIDRINPPPENVIEMNVAPSTNTILGTNLVSSVNTRLSNPQIYTQRPTVYSQQPNIVTRQLQPPAAQQIIRQTIQANTRQTRPIGNTMAILTPQTTLSIPNANLRPIAPSSPIRQPIQNVSTPGIRTVAVPTSALTNIKQGQMIKSEESKSDNVTIISEIQKPIECHSNNITLPTNIVNHVNYRNKVSEVFKSESGNVNISEDALNYISEAIENFSISLLEQAAAFSCHRQEMFINDPMYKKIDDVRSQMKYLQDYEEYQRTSEEERQKAELFKAAKSRSKIDNQEQQKIKETVKKIQEYDKTCDEYSRANSTALKAIGNKRKNYEAEESGYMQPGFKGGRSLITRPGGFNMEFGNNAPGSQIYINSNYLAGKQPRSIAVASRHRNKRIILKDFQLVLDQDVKLKRFKTFKKIFMFGRY